MHRAIEYVARVVRFQLQSGPSKLVRAFCDALKCQASHSPGNDPRVRPRRRSIMHPDYRCTDAFRMNDYFPRNRWKNRSVSRFLVTSAIYGNLNAFPRATVNSRAETRGINPVRGKEKRKNVLRELSWELILIVNVVWIDKYKGESRAFVINNVITTASTHLSAFSHCYLLQFRFHGDCGCFLSTVWHTVRCAYLRAYRVLIVSRSSCPKSERNGLMIS